MILFVFITNKGLDFDGFKQDAVQLQNTSNLIVRNILNDVIQSGGVNKIESILSKDIYAALERNNQTLDGWAGSIFYWNLRLDSGKYKGKTVGEVISDNPKDFVKNNTILKSTIDELSQKYGRMKVLIEAGDTIFRGSFVSRQFDLLISPIGRQ
ncbi:hypothetical protein ACG9Y7_00725 [Acinetobacter gerneri]|uniref:hypothetical protein n=1 Tax=Acinetobacter gerneri TaxID=202952 RepID=UPI003AF6E6F5